MSETRSFRKYWVSLITERHKAFEGIQTTTEFENQIKSLVNSLVNSIAADIANGNYNNLDTQQAKAKIKERNKSIFEENGKIDQCTKRYKTCHSWLSDLLTLRIQEDWATTWDHVKNFLFKTITAIMLAAVILGTAYIANQLGILIPSIRVGL